MLIKVFIKRTHAMQMKLLLMIIVVLLVLATEGQWYLSVCFYLMEMLNVSDENTFWFLGTILAMISDQPLPAVCFTEEYACVHERRGQIIVTEGLKASNGNLKSIDWFRSECLSSQWPGFLQMSVGPHTGGQTPYMWEQFGEEVRRYLRMPLCDLRGSHPGANLEAQWHGP